MTLGPGRAEVDISLRAGGDDTEVTPTQSNLVGDATAADSVDRPDYEKNWAIVPSGLKTTAEG